MTIGIIREGKNPPDKRVPLNPQQCVELQKRFGVKVLVQPSEIRAYNDREYADAGLELSEDLSACDVLMGVKEVPVDMLIDGKTYFFFSHTYKEQPYNRGLLQSILEKNIRLVDYEMLTGRTGNRLVAFGKYAGIVGAYNGLLGWGLKKNLFQLKPAHACHDKKEMYAQFDGVDWSSDMRIVMTGKGRVAGGAIETLNAAGIKRVSPEAFLTQDFDEAVFTDLDVEQYNKSKDGSPFSKEIFYEHGDQFESDFMRFAEKANMYMACHYWDNKAPFIFSREDAKKANFNIELVADISCDIDGPVASTLRPSTIAEPFYGYLATQEKEVEFANTSSIGVMAVDNLPCELPRDASDYFGHDLLENVIPHLFDGDPDAVIARATETENGKLTDFFAYLQDYVNQPA